MAQSTEPPPQHKNTEDYENYGVNPLTDTAKDNLSTFAIDVDTGSYTIARRKINEGKLPPKDSVRVEEYLNYFRYEYPQPDAGPFGVSMDAAPSPFAEDRKLLRIGVQGKKLTTNQRKPVHLTFLVDTSGSMSSADKLGLAVQSLEILTNNLREGDTVSICTYAGGTGVVLEPTGMHERGKILEALRNLRAGGSTAMASGLQLAYDRAMQSHEPGHVSRVIVLSDGDANVGSTKHGPMLKSIKHYVDEGIMMSTIGFGMGNYKDTTMEQLANKGNGNYYYVDNIEEARKVFGDQMDGTLQVIAKDVKIQVEFDEEAVSQYRLIGYENRDIADEDFRDDKVDAGEIGAGHTVTALYELKLDPESEKRDLATVRVRHKKPDGFKASESQFAFTRDDMGDDLAQADADLRFAAAVAMFAEVLRESPYAKELTLEHVEALASNAMSSKQLDRQEFLSLVRKAAALAK